MKKVALLLLSMIFALMLLSCQAVQPGGAGEGHVHTYEGQLQYNETAHFYRCTCGKAGTPEVHADINKDGVCDACGFGMELIICEHQWVEYCDKPTTCALCGRWEWGSEPRGHEYDDEVTAPTCTEAGFTTHVCKHCGYTHVDTIVEALGHTPVVDDAVAPTCVNTGLTEGSHCGVCGEILTAQEVVDALGHDWAVATCNDPATCNVCGETTGDAIGHDTISHEGKPATCLDKGYKAYETCSRCDYTTYEEIPALGHKPGDVVVENNVLPDCENKGSYENVVYCTVCGEELSRTTVTVDALGHKGGEIVVENNVAPDCENDGSYDNVVYCTVCGEELSRGTVTVDALGHKGGEIVVENNVDPDCENKGSYENVVYCTVCGEELSRTTVTVDALGHKGGVAKVENNVAPDCENAGSYENVVCCTVCGEELSRETVTVDALGHTWGEEPIDFINNKNIFSCTAKDCNARAIEEINQTTASVSIVDYATAKSWENSVQYESIELDNVVTVTASTKGNNGKYYTSGTNWRLYQSDSGTMTVAVTDQYLILSVKITYTPGNNGYLLNNLTKISSNDIVTVNTSSITLAVGSSGNNGQARITAIEVVYVIGNIEECEHSTTTTTNSASCTEGGIITVACADCGIIISQESTGAIPHKPVVDNAVAATCTETGLTEGSHCDVCGEVLVAQEEVPVLGHDMADATCTKPSTCKRTGCNYTEGATLDHKDENADYKCDACSTKMLPAADSTLTIEQALAVAAVAGTAYTTDKYYVTGIVTNVYNTTYGNMYIKDENGKQLCIYGLYTWDKETRYDAMTYKPVEGDELTVYGVLGMYNTTKQMKNAWMDEVVAHEHNYDEGVVTEATCTKDGYTTYTCSICFGTYTDNVITAPGHTYVDGSCSVCGAEKPACEHVGKWVTTHTTHTEICSICEAVITAEASHTFEDGLCACGADNLLTGAEFNALGAAQSEGGYTSLKFRVTGVITSLKNTTYGNLYIKDAEGTQVYIYGLYSEDGKRYDAMSVKPGVGDTITVLTICGNHYSDPQGKNATLLNHEVHTCASTGEWQKDETNHWQLCDLCGVELNKASHTVVEGACVCGYTEDTVLPTTVSVVIQDYASANSWVNATKYTTVKVDENITVTATGTDQNTGKYYTSGYEWRTYQTGNPDITVTAAEGYTILSVKITYSISKTGILTLNGSNVASGTEVTVNASSITFGVGNTGSATNGQVKITAIEVVYKAN